MICTNGICSPKKSIARGKLANLSDWGSRRVDCIEEGKFKELNKRENIYLLTKKSFVFGKVDVLSDLDERRFTEEWIAEMKRSCSSS